VSGEATKWKIETDRVLALQGHRPHRSIAMTDNTFDRKKQVLPSVGGTSQAVVLRNCLTASRRAWLAIVLGPRTTRSSFSAEN